MDVHATPTQSGTVSESAGLESSKSGPEVADTRRYYQAGGGRKTFFAVLFIVLMPFFISLPPMIWQRVSAGVWVDTWGLFVIAALFLLVMILVFLELMFSLRAKVDLGTRAVAFTLPADGGGMTPTFAYETRLVEYEDIAAVETFREIYGGLGCADAHARCAVDYQIRGTGSAWLFQRSR